LRVELERNLAPPPRDALQLSGRRRGSIEASGRVIGGVGPLWYSHGQPEAEPPDPFGTGSA